MTLLTPCTANIGGDLLDDDRGIGAMECHRRMAGMGFTRPANHACHGILLFETARRAPRHATLFTTISSLPR
jgi:hypothetical protein